MLYYFVFLHMTHETQPLDVSVFKPLKLNWQACCRHFYNGILEELLQSINFLGCLSRHGI